MKVLVLCQASEGSILPKIVTSSAEVSSSPSVGLKLNQRPDASGRIIRSILLNKEPRLSQSSSQAEQKLQGSTAERSKRPPRPSNIKAGVPASVGEQSPSGSDYVGKRAGEDKSSGREPHGFGSAREKQDRRTRSRERLDRGVWTPRRSDSSHTGDENQSNISDSYEGIFYLFLLYLIWSIGGRILCGLIYIMNHCPLIPHNSTQRFFLTPDCLLPFIVLLWVSMDPKRVQLFFQSCSSQLFGLSLTDRIMSGEGKRSVIRSHSRRQQRKGVF